MKLLPNNCRYSEPSVSPANYKSCGPTALKKKWYIKYRFYDDSLGRAKQIVISRFNTYTTLQDRRDAIDECLKGIRQDLEVYGWNPFSETTLVPVVPPEDQVINKWTPFLDALNFAKTKMQVSEHTMKNEIEFVIGQIEESVKSLHYDRITIWNMTLKNLFLICEKASYKPDKSYSGAKFNRNKKVLRQLYAKLLMLEVVPANLPMSLERQKEPPRKKKVTLTKEEREKLIKHLQAKSPRFLLLIQVFFHSGARLTEVLRLKVKDVDLKNQSINYLILKGKQQQYKDRPIKDIAVDYWRQCIAGGQPDDYVFSTRLKPGPKEITTNPIKLRWRRLQKDLKITAGFYSLKHLNTTETVSLIGHEAAAIQNAESREMIKKHYDVDSIKREHDAIKKVNNPL